MHLLKVLQKNRSLLLVSSGHFTVDIFGNLWPVMFPLLALSFGLSYAQVGLIATLYQTSSSLGQPLFGYLGDRFGSRFLASGGIMSTACCVSLVGYIPSYPALLTLAAIAGLGSAAFHPQGALSTAYMGGEHKGTNMSIFTMGGTTGFALGPLIGAALIIRHGLQGLVFLALPASLYGLWLYRTMKELDRRRVAVAVPSDDAPRGAIPFGKLSIVILISTLRAWAIAGVITYIPLLYKERGFGVDFSSQIIFLIIGFSVFGMFGGGFLADRFSPKLVVSASLLLATPAILLFLHTPFPSLIVFAVLTGILLEASLPITLVAAQELLPRYVGMASGLALGLSFTVGAIGILLTGLLADRHGLLMALSLLAMPSFLGALLSLGFPEIARTRERRIKVVV